MDPGTLLLLKLMVVTELRRARQDVTLHFSTGAHGHLEVKDKDRDYVVRLAERSQQRRHPVGIRLTAGGAIIGIYRADSDVPRDLVEGEDQIRIFFQGHDGIYMLRRSHPDFAHLHGILDDARRFGRRVWFCAGEQAGALEDVILG